MTTKKIEAQFTGDTRQMIAGMKRASRAIYKLNDAWERSLRRSRRLRFAGTRRHRIARLWWRLWYGWSDWRWRRRNPEVELTD